MNTKKTIGIDPGVMCGYAIKSNGVITSVRTYRIWELFEEISCNSSDILYVVEDARKRGGPVAAAQGAGWVKVLSGQIEAYLKENECNYKMIAPIRNGTKLNSAQVKSITGWDPRSNQHERDAIIIAWNH